MAFFEKLFAKIKKQPQTTNSNELTFKPQTNAANQNNVADLQSEPVVKSKKNVKLSKDFNERLDIYYKNNDRFRSLTISEQLCELESQTDKTDAIIGKIYIRRIELTGSNDDMIKYLSHLLDNAKCVNSYAICGQGDVALVWLFAKNNLLIGIDGISYRGSPFVVGDNYKVYRFANQEQLYLNYEKVRHLLF